MPSSRLKLLVVIVDISAGTGTFCLSLGTGLRRFFPDEIAPSLLLMRGAGASASSPPPILRGRARLGAEPSGEAAQWQAYENIYTIGASVHSDWRRWYETPLDIVRLRNAIRQISPDVIFTIGTYSNLLTRAVCGDRPVILSEHMNMSRRIAAARFGFVMQSLMRRVYPRHLIVCAARGLTRDLELNFGATRTAVIPNGVDLDRVRAMANEDAGPLPTDRPYVVAVGRLTPQKDFATLMRGVAAARAGGSDLHLIIAGDGEERTPLDELGRTLGLLGAVHFVGHKPNPYPLMKRARMLALTSLWEGFAYVPIEAMTLDVPCIATCSEGPAAIFENGKYGMLVPVQNPAALAEAIVKMNEPVVHDHYVRLARDRAAQLSLERMVRAYRDLFVSAA